MLVFYDSVRANCSATMSAMENVTVNAKEQRRGLVIAQVDRGEVLVAEGAALLAAYRQRGVAALAHGNRGKAPRNAVDEETR